jgi:hypothetical protein
MDRCLDATLTAIAWETTADELVDTILTRSSILAGITSALVHITKAACIVISTRTFALEAVHKVHANTAICTWIACTFIDVGFTVLASEPGDAVARIPVQRNDKHSRYSRPGLGTATYSNTQYSV